MIHVRRKMMRFNFLPDTRCSNTLSELYFPNFLRYVFFLRWRLRRCRETWPCRFPSCLLRCDEAACCSLALWTCSIKHWPNLNPSLLGFAHSWVSSRSSSSIMCAIARLIAKADCMRGPQGASRSPSPSGWCRSFTKWSSGVNTGSPARWGRN